MTPSTRAGDGLLRKLAGGDRRSIGRVAEVIADVEANPRLFSSLVRAMVATDACVAMRAADAVEKLSARHSDWLDPHAEWLIGKVSGSALQEVRWHFAQISPRLKMSRGQRQQVVAILESYLDDRSAIVKTSAMQALTDVALADDNLLPIVARHIQELTQTGTPAMRARGRKLQVRLARAVDEKEGAPRERCARGVPLRRE